MNDVDYLLMNKFSTLAAEDQRKIVESGRAMPTIEYLDYHGKCGVNRKFQSAAWYQRTPFSARPYIETTSRYSDTVSYTHLRAHET